MNKSYNSKGLPSTVLTHDYRHLDAIATVDGLMHQSKSYIFTGDITNYELLKPSTGNALSIKGISITGDGNSGTVKLIRSGNSQVIFPAYFSAQVKGGPSPAFNLVLNTDEKVLITTTSRGTSESFVGISYIEYDPNNFIN